MIYPILYEQNTTDFFNLGLGPLTDMTKALVTEERNGAFYFEGEILTSSPQFKQLKNNMIIKVDAGHKLKSQRFRIKRVIDKHDGTAEIYAEHVSYLASELSLKPVVGVGQLNAHAAISRWRGSIIDENPFVVDSDILTVGSTEWTIDTVNNAREALGGVRGSLLDVYGGEYRFDNYHISLLKKRGTPANTLLAYGRNIIDFEQERNILDTYTSVFPFAKYTENINSEDGKSDSKEHLVTLDGYFVDAENWKSFPNRKAKVIDLSEKFGQDEVPTKEKLKKLAEQYVKNNDIGVPKTSIKVSFVDLSKTLDYADIAPLEELNLCDEVTVKYPSLGVDTTAKVVRIVWNVLTESYDEIEIGEKRMSLSTVINDVQTAVKQAKDESGYALIAANGRNTVFYGLFGQDGKGEPKATMVGDLWYKPNGEDTELYIWNGELWEFIMSTAENKVIKETIDKLEQQADQSIKDIQTALDTAKQAVEQSSLSEKASKEAKIQSDKAIKDAQTAIDKSTLSEQASNEAKIQSKQALDKADKSVETADFSKNLAEQANQKAINAQADAVNAKKSADQSILDAKKALEQSASNQQTTEQLKVNIDKELKVKADKTELDKTNQTVQTQSNQIKLNSDALKLKAEKTAVDTLTNTVNSQKLLIDANSKGLTVKADKSEVNAVKDTVSKQSGELSVLNNKIEATVSDVSKQSTTIANLKLESDRLNSTVVKTQSQLDNIDASNRNLIFRTGELVDRMIADNGLSATLYGHSMQAEYVDITNIKQLTVNLDVLSPDVNGKNVRIGFYDKNKKFINRVVTTNIPKSVVINVPKDTAYFRGSYPTKDNVKIEKGDKFTGFNLAVEDIQTKAEFSSFEQTYQVFKQQVTNDVSGVKSAQTQLSNQITSLVENDKGQSTKINQIESLVNINSTSISKTDKQVADLTLKADRFSVDISNNSKQIASLNQTAEGFNSSVKQINADLSGIKSSQTQMSGQITSTVEKVNNINVPNANLLFRTGELVHRMIGENGLSANLDGHCMQAEYLEVKSAKQLTVTLKMTGQEINGKNVRIGFYDKDKKFISRTMTVKDIQTLDIPKNAVYFRASYPLNCQIKIELGNHSTGLTVANEDVAEKSQITQLSNLIDLTTKKSDEQIASLRVQTDRISTNIQNTDKQVSSLNQTVDGFNTTVKQINTDLTSVKSEQVQLAGQWSSTIGKIDYLDSKPNLLKKADSTSISNVYSDWKVEHLFASYSSVDGVKTVLADYGVYTSSESYIGNYTRLDVPIPGKVAYSYSARVYTETPLKLKLEYFRWRVDGTGERFNTIVTTKIGWNILKAENHLFDNTFGIEVRISPLQTGKFHVNWFKAEQNSTATAPSPTVDTSGFAEKSEITQLTNLINLRVTKDDLISQINIQANRQIFQVGSNKLMITPDTTYIQNATIKSAMIDTMTASKINTGTLNAANVNIINLNVNSLTGNTSQFVRTAWNGISKSVQITSEGMISYRNGGGVSAKYLSDGLQIWNGSKWVGSMSYSTRGLVLWAKKSEWLDLGYQGSNTEGNIYTTAIGINGSTGDIYFDGKIRTAGANLGLYFKTYNYNNYGYPSLQHEGGQTGFLFGPGYLYYVHNGQIKSFEEITRLVNGFYSMTTKSIAVPHNINGQGTVTSWTNITI